MKEEAFKDYAVYLLIAFLSFFAPITGLLIAVGVAIILDTITGVYKSIKISGWSSVRSRRFSNIFSKMVLYQATILLLFIMDHYLLQEFVKNWFQTEYLFTKMTALVMVMTELVSIKENIEEAQNIDIWKLLKKMMTRAKEIRKDADEITGK